MILSFSASLSESSLTIGFRYCSLRLTYMYIGVYIVIHSSYIHISRAGAQPLLENIIQNMIQIKEVSI